MCVGFPAVWAHLTRRSIPRHIHALRPTELDSLGLGRTPLQLSSINHAAANSAVAAIIRNKIRTQIRRRLFLFSRASVTNWQWAGTLKPQKSVVLWFCLKSRCWLGCTCESWGSSPLTCPLVSGGLLLTLDSLPHPASFIFPWCVLMLSFLGACLCCFCYSYWVRSHFNNLFWFDYLYKDCVSKSVSILSWYLDIDILLGWGG